MDEMILKRCTKKVNGKTYTYLNLVESYRDEGKVRQRLIYSFGNIQALSTAQIDGILQGLAQYSSLKVLPADQIEPLGSRSYGDIRAIQALWDELKIGSFIRKLLRQRQLEIDVALLTLLMVANRLMDPSSKLGLTRWLHGIYLKEMEGRPLEVHQFYRALGYLDEIKPALEEEIFAEVRNLFSLQVDLVFYDITSTFFQGNGPPELAQKGKSRDRRPDKRQIILALLLTQEGLPIAHEVLPGNTADVTTVKQVLKGLQKRFHIRRCIFVGDRGMISRENLQEIQKTGYQYILAVKAREKKGFQLLDADLNHYRTLEDKPATAEDKKTQLLVKDIWIGEKERYLVCHNPQKAQEERQRRQKRIAQLVEKLTKLQAWIQKGHLPEESQILQRLSYLLSSPEKRKYIQASYRPGLGLQFSVNQKTLKAEELLDGKYILQTDVADLSAPEVIQSYKDLRLLEDAFKDMKDFLKLRPLYHYDEKHVRGHVFVCVLAYLVGRILENKLAAANLAATMQSVLEELEEIQLVDISFPDGLVVQKLTHVGPSQQRILNALGLQKILQNRECVDE